MSHSDKFFMENNLQRIIYAACGLASGSKLFETPK